MLRFTVFENGAPAKKLDLSSAYLVGADRVPLRADLKFVDGQVHSDARSRGAAALAILWTVPGVGRIMLETTRLMDRDEPYNLHVELARGQLMRISQKREDWGLYDFKEGEPLYAEVEAARKILVEALTAPDDVTAAKLAEECIVAGVKIGEAISTFHAEVFLQRRRQAGQLSKRVFGCGVEPAQVNEPYLRKLTPAFDFAVLPFQWRAMEPKEGTHQATRLDPVLQALRQLKVPVWGASLVSFEAKCVPEWLGKWAKDYEHVRDCVAKHVKHALKTYGPYVHAWEIIRGLHAHNPYRFSFEQIMELTRITALLVKQMSPKCVAMLGLTLPWGEYYAHDPRTIPPTLYAEMAVSSGINFDAFGLDLRFGVGESGPYVRDMLQISSMLDRIGGLGKPIHVITSGVPSAGHNAQFGNWHGPWSEPVQAHWVKDFYRICLSKPFVESVTYQTLVDGEQADGLLRADFTPKESYQALLALKQEGAAG